MENKKTYSNKYNLVGTHIDFCLNKEQTRNIEKFYIERVIKLHIKKEKIKFNDNQKKINVFIVLMLV